MNAVYKFIVFNLLEEKKKCFDWKRFIAFSHILDAIHVEILGSIPFWTTAEVS